MQLSKSQQKAYAALEQRVTDIFNCATGNGYTADEWTESAWVGVEEVGNVMRAIELTFDLSVIYDNFKLQYFHAKHFGQPRTAAEWLWELKVRK